MGQRHMQTMPAPQTPPPEQDVNERLIGKVFNLPHAICPNCDFLHDIEICDKCGGWCTCDQECDHCDQKFALDWSEPKKHPGGER